MFTTTVFDKTEESPRAMAVRALQLMLAERDPNVRLSAAKALLDYGIK